MDNRRLLNATVGLAAGLLAVLTVSRPAARGQDSIQILHDEVTIEYPYSVSIDLSAMSSAAPITTVRIFWQAGPEDTFHVQPLTFRPARSVDLRFPLSPQLLSLPPFTQISYRWQIRDELGNQLTTESRTVEYEDTRHEWQELSNERLRVLWYDLDSSFAQALLEIADAAYLRLADAFGVELDSRPVIVIYPNQADFAEFQRFLNNLEFVVGRYFPGHNITVNLVTPEMPRAVYEATIAHELSHLYSDNFYIGFARIPLWLEEGLATYNEALNRDDDLRAVRRAAAQGELIPFIDLPQAIRHPNVALANLAYNEGATVLAFIEERWGPDGLSDFLAAFRRTTSVGQVTASLFGLTIAEFEMGWRAWLGYPVDEVPQMMPTATLIPLNIPTPTFVFPSG